MTKLWGGRFEQEPAAAMQALNDSIRFDVRLAQVDIRGSQAYAQAIQRLGLLTNDEANAIETGLQRVAGEFTAGTFAIQPGDEDIHTAVERRLAELIGPAAGKLHTGRSRNDQVATDLRLYVMEELDRLAALLQSVCEALLSQAQTYLPLLMPGYTHLQPAQPVRFSHWLLSYFWMFQRDRERLAQVRARTAQFCPLGAGALAGHPFGLDRAELAHALGFASPAPNSLDAVSDRDFALETLTWAALLGTHLARLGEDLVIWSSREFGFVRLADAYSTGSSLMPQKRNPDSAELLRGKAGRLTGNLVTLLTVSKGLPSSYDKDLQEDKEPLFDTLDTLAVALPVAAAVLQTLQPNAERMRAALTDDLLATDLADYLVRKGLPFRQSHHVIGQVVRRAEALGVPLRALPLAEYQAVSPLFTPDVQTTFDFERSVEQRSATGGTALAAVRAQIEQAQEVLKRCSSPAP